MAALTKTTHDCGAAPRESKMRECLPCELPPFCRNEYYTGKLLTERDFAAEQRYVTDKLRLHHVALHGWGIVCGLRVKPHPYCPDKRVVVEPGLAIDGCGREIFVPEEFELPLPEPPPPPPGSKTPCPPDPKPPEPKPPAEGEPGKPPWDRPDQGPFPEQTARQEEPRKPGFEQRPPERPKPKRPKPVDLYLSICYAECETEFSVAPFDDCSCNGNGKRPNRVCETSRWELHTEKPPLWDEIRKRKEKCDEDCDDIYEQLRCCPRPGEPICLPLTALCGVVLGEPVTEEHIDNDSYRCLLPSTRVLDDLIRCLLEKLPTKKLTRIVDVGWNHGGEYTCADFVDAFVGDQQSPKGFEVSVDAPIRPEGVSLFSFQAVVVRHETKGHAGGALELAPGKVWVSQDRSKIYLRLDPDYVHDHLRGYDFDVFLTLRCGQIVDERGCPVDGDLLARLQSDGAYIAAPPTGDGTPGGNFESWIQVRG